MKYIKQIFERLSRGGFIYSDSTQEEMKRLFIDLEDNLISTLVVKNQKLN